MLHRPNKIVVEGEIAIMDLTLRDGTVIKTIFDAEDVPKVRAFKNRWIAWYEKRMDKYYVLSVDTSNRGRKQMRLHRFLTDCPEGYVPDHINHNTLDNRKSNLRIVPQAVNLQNKSGAYRSSKTGIRGVYYHKASGKWYGTVQLDRKPHSKLFDTIEEAAQYAESTRKKLFSI